MYQLSLQKKSKLKAPYIHTKWGRSLLVHEVY